MFITEFNKLNQLFFFYHLSSRVMKEINNNAHITESAEKIPFSAPAKHKIWVTDSPGYSWDAILSLNKGGAYGSVYLKLKFSHSLLYVL